MFHLHHHSNVPTPPKSSSFWTHRETQANCFLNVMNVCYFTHSPCSLDLACKDNLFTFLLCEKTMSHWQTDTENQTASRLLYTYSNPWPIVVEIINRLGYRHRNQKLFFLHVELLVDFSSLVRIKCSCNYYTHTNTPMTLPDMHKYLGL